MAAALIEAQLVGTGYETPDLLALRDGREGMGGRHLQKAGSSLLKASRNLAVAGPQATPAPMHFRSAPTTPRS